ncbi:hypothetical protein Vadar_021068 [Vaccinium darrowii]|uniref:Uncharacterized protein n=1 Tax=Vaccinium darrowii TaxID=229202 RepID=A0ACB7YNA7_9ERIC|nr:hypothetical protein Vadar_021068 [Vaccinium darrowii]
MKINQASRSSQEQQQQRRRLILFDPLGPPSSAHLHFIFIRQLNLHSRCPLAFKPAEDSPLSPRWHHLVGYQPQFALPRIRIYRPFRQALV